MRFCLAPLGLNGGAALSAAWEAAGGTAVRLDIKNSPSHYFLHGESNFWANELIEPADIYTFGFPCTSMSLAHSTPRVRDKAHPYGWGDPQAKEGNELAFCMIRRVLGLVAEGACILIENPLFSYIWFCLASCLA